MADLFSLLSLGANALSAHRAASATASHNLENANTPGYSRQRAELEAMLPAYRLGGAFLGQGVRLGTVSQARDRGAEAQFSAAHQSHAHTSAQADALEQLSALDPQGADALGASLADFYGAMRALAQNPGDSSLRQAAVARAQTAALSFNRVAQQAARARDAVDQRMSGQLSEVNTLAAQLASLNRQVRVARGSGAEPNDLLDARQKTQDRLVELLGAVPIPTSDGDVNLALPKGGALVTADLAGTVSLTPDTTNGAHLKVQLRGAGAATPQDATPGGAFAGMLAARDGALKSAESALDALAFDWANGVNAVHRSGFGLDGAGGRDLFTVSATSTGAAGALAVDAAITSDPTLLAAAGAAATVPGDGTNLQALIATESQALTTSGLDPLASWSSMVSAFGAAAQQARTNATADAAVLEHVTGLRESISGVSIDEELLALQRAQRGFEAVMKVIQTTNDLLDTLMSLKS